MIYFTELENLPIYDPRGDEIGRLFDLGLAPSQTPLLVASYLVRTTDKRLLRIDYEKIQSISVRAAHTTVPSEKIRPYSPDESMMRIKKDVLDQQIIDVNLRKVVRVNDVDFDIRPVNGHTELRILAVNVGMAGGVRRLLQGVVSKQTMRQIESMFPTKAIPWEFVNLIEPDPARRVKLRISFDRVAKLHPADIGDILENLSRDEQKAVIESLDDQTAAQALSEIPTDQQAALLESIPTQKAADIVEEMPPDEAADVLQKLPPETTAEVLADMRTAEAKEVEQLLAFKENTAGALMTTEFLMVGEAATVEGAIAALANYQGPLESIHVIFLIRNGGVLAGAVPLAKILLAGSETPLKTLAMEPLVSVPANDDGRTVLDLFHKYNLVELPVVDDDGRLLGVVTVDDVLEVALNRK